MIFPAKNQTFFQFQCLLFSQKLSSFKHLHSNTKDFMFYNKYALFIYFYTVHIRASVVIINNLPFFAAAQLQYLHLFIV